MDVLDALLGSLQASSDEAIRPLLQLIRQQAPLEEIVQCARRLSETANDPQRAAAFDTESDAPRMRRSVMDISVLCNSPIVKVPAKPWTAVTNDDDFVSHLVSLYLTWWNPYYRSIDSDLFVRDMAAGDLSCSFCSPLLVNAVLLLSCVRRGLSDFKCTS